MRCLSDQRYPKNDARAHGRDVCGLKFGEEDTTKVSHAKAQKQTESHEKGGKKEKEGGTREKETWKKVGG